MIEIVPTNTCPPDFAELSRRSASIASFAPTVQLDVSDGVFTAISSWPYLEGQMTELDELRDSQALPSSPALQYELHLMVEEPREIGCMFARAGAMRIIGHVEAFADTEEARGALDAWRLEGAREIGLALLLDTPMPVLEPLIPMCDVVQVMSIGTLGSQGAAYDPRAKERIAELHAKYPTLTIAVDGGVSETNIAELVAAGARRFGVGSAIMKAADPRKAYEHLKTIAESALE